MNKKGILGLFIFVLLTSLLIGNNLIFAADYPNKPIEFAIPWPAGGRTDVAARVMAPYFEKYLGVPVVVVNKLGGGGVLGMIYVRDAKPDGYTFSHGGMALTNFQYQKPGNLSLWDYTWICRTQWTMAVLAVNKNSPFKNLKDLVDYARANPGKLRHGNTATGSTTHIASEAFAKKFGIKFTQVPYKGEGETVKGIGAGEVDLAFGLMLAFRPLVENGTIRILGECGAKRSSLYPQIPTFREQGFDFLSPTWDAILTPKYLPKDVYQKLSEACKKVYTDPELIEKFGKMGYNISYQPAPELLEFLKSWDKEIKELTYDLGLEFKK
jgi:tripartite-type tricarboxylate transporter receptor subunit TctC